MNNKKSIFHPIKLVGALVFLMAFVLNIQTSLNGDWELVNVGYSVTSTGGEGCFIRTSSNCPTLPGQTGGGERVTCDLSGTTVPGSTCTPVVCYAGAKDPIVCGEGSGGSAF